MQFPTDEPENSGGLQLDYEYYIPPPPSPIEETPVWTWRRIVLVTISLLVVLAMLITFYLPGIMVAINNRDRPPRATPTIIPQANLPDDYQLDFV